MVYQKEQAAMHKLCMKVKGDPKLAKKDVVVAIGSAEFLATRRGMKWGAPVKRLIKTLKRYVTVVRVSEMRTSRVCSNGCGWDEEPADAAEAKQRQEDFDLIPMRGERSASGCAGAALYTVKRCKSAAWYGIAM